VLSLSKHKNGFFSSPLGRKPVRKRTLQTLPKPQE